jgi:hypothetical protein
MGGQMLFLLKNLRLTSKPILLPFYFLIFTFAFRFLSCDKIKTPTEVTLPKPQIKLSLAEAPRLREIRLKVELSNVKLPRDFQLNRLAPSGNDSIILRGQLVTSDSEFKETGLTPATEYRYRAYLLQNGAITDTSNLLQVHTMDTTSHNYVWTIDTIGTIGSTLLDVFAISENDVWAVGDIDTGANQSFNAMHWDGIEWKFRRIFFYLCPNGTTPTPYPIQTIFAFSKNSIWYTRGASFVNWDGNEYMHDCSMNSIIDGSIQKIWGTSYPYLYAVGYIGTIIHYNGSSWQKLESGTDLRLTDIWGFADGSIYITGSNSSTLDNVFLVFKANQLQKKIDDATWRKKSVWGIASDRLYVAGSGLFFYDGDNLTSLPWPSNLPFIHVENLRGSEENNIFMVGHFGFVAHYNGSTWKYYSEVSRDITLQSVAVLENEVFAVGYDSFFGYLYHGRRIN